MIRVGQKLREERLKKGLTIEEIARATKIKESFLLTIENGEYEKLPSSTYAQGFVRNYIEFLNLPVAETLALFRREYNEEKVFKVLPEGLSGKEEFSLKKNKFQNTIAAAAVAFIVLLIYIFFQYRHAFIDPRLEVFTPKEEAIISSQNILVSGKTDPNAAILVNNEPASLDKDGRFSKTITSFIGKTIITIKAVNNFGRQKTLERHVEIK